MAAPAETEEEVEVAGRPAIYRLDRTASTRSLEEQSRDAAPVAATVAARAPEEDEEALALAVRRKSKHPESSFLGSQLHHLLDWVTMRLQSENPRPEDNGYDNVPCNMASEGPTEKSVSSSLHCMLTAI